LPPDQNIVEVAPSDRGQDNAHGAAFSLPAAHCHHCVALPGLAVVIVGRDADPVDRLRQIERLEPAGIDSRPAWQPTKELHRRHRCLDAFTNDQLAFGIVRRQTDRAATDGAAGFALQFLMAEIRFVRAIGTQIG
jgi:hypothetical protein